MRLQVDLLLFTIICLEFCIRNEQRRVHGFPPITGRVGSLQRTTTKLTSVTSSTTSSPATGLTPSRWDSFDYLQHWYPVSWVCDLPKNQPTKLALFDVDYAVAVKDDGSAIALVDVCPHRAAALSEGRITESGFLQCAYHGWSFSETGECMQIPQAAEGSTYSPRTCAKAVPARVHQGMVWLWPGPEKDNLPDPPTIPEIDDPRFKVTRAVRDFPIVDWSLLLSNILDPDHGIFAHQLAAFDMYSASPEYPLETEESFDNAGWTLTTRVPAVEKQRVTDRFKRGQPFKQQSTNVTATTVYYAPCVATIGRRDENNETSFLTCFWVCPTGTGRSRFMSAAVGKTPFRMPRWITHVFLNQFLDQDTLLVASQQPAVLSAEAEAVEKDSGRKAGGNRQSMFVYQSPTDRAVRLVDQFWDETLSRAPNRIKSLLAMKRAGALQGVPSRSVVLDREQQHLAVCPDSQVVVKNCERVRRFGLLATAGWLALCLTGQKVPWGWPVLTSFAAWAATKIRQGFFYTYTERKRDRDLANIPSKMWLDPEKSSRFT